MSVYRMVLAGILAGTAAAALAHDHDTAALQQAVRCAEIDFALSVANRDKRAFAELVHPDARFVGNEVARGRDAVVEAWSVFFADDGPRITWRPMIVEVLDSGDLALSRGPYRFTGTVDDGSPIEQWGTFNSTWQRQPDGRWQVVFDAGGPAAEEFPETVKKLLLEPATACPTD